MDLTYLIFLAITTISVGQFVWIAWLYSDRDKLRAELADEKRRAQQITDHCADQVRQRRMAEAKLAAALEQPVYGRQIVGSA